jgi:hypothetical protein
VREWESLTPIESDLAYVPLLEGMLPLLSEALKVSNVSASQGRPVEAPRKQDFPAPVMGPLAAPSND